MTKDIEKKNRKQWNKTTKEMRQRQKVKKKEKD